MREIQAFLAEIYAIDVSPDLISAVTDAVVAEVTEWQARPLERLYPVVFFDALRVKIRDEGVVRSKAVYLALAMLPDGTRDILGIWIEQTEGAKFWLKVFTDLKARGCAGHPHRRDRWPQGHAGSARGRVSGDDAPDLYRAFDSQQPGVCELETAQGAGGGAAPGLYRGQCGRGAGGLGRVCGGAVGPAVSDGRQGVAPRLAARHSLLRVSARDSSDDLHHQCARERERARAQDHQDPRPLPDR